MILEIENQPLSFKDFFPIFKNSILAIIFMHLNNIVHRDIKPANIIMLGDNRYTLCDYGEGINLNYSATYSKNDFF